MAKVSLSSSGVKIKWGASHKDGNGKLIVRQVSIEPPKITCLKVSCLWKYAFKSFTYTLVLLYHQNRTAYAEKHRHNTISDKYRTGEPSPETIWQAIKEILIVKMKMKFKLRP